MKGDMRCVWCSCSIAACERTLAGGSNTTSGVRAVALSRAKTTDAQVTVFKDMDSGQVLVITEENRAGVFDGWALVAQPSPTPLEPLYGARFHN